jgi:hypothetical protein
MTLARRVRQLEDIDAVSIRDGLRILSPQIDAERPVMTRAAADRVS